MLIENADYFVHVVPFPCRSADGIVTPNDDGTFSIYLDANVSDAQQREALAHELEHIQREHFYTDRPIHDLEAEADCHRP